jgi:hypothetical protein
VAGPSSPAFGGDGVDSTAFSARLAAQNHLLKALAIHCHTALSSSTPCGRQDKWTLHPSPAGSPGEEQDPRAQVSGRCPRVGSQTPVDSPLPYGEHFPCPQAQPQFCVPFLYLCFSNVILTPYLVVCVHLCVYSSFLCWRNKLQLPTVHGVSVPPL